MLTILPGVPSLRLGQDSKYLDGKQRGKLYFLVSVVEYFDSVSLTPLGPAMMWDHGGTPRDLHCGIWNLVLREPLQ